jgi:hypothetical protein
MSITRGSAVGLDVTLSALDDGGRLANVKISGVTGASSAGLMVSRDDLVRANQPGAADLGSEARGRRARARGEGGTDDTTTG